MIRTLYLKAFLGSSLLLSLVISFLFCRAAPLYRDSSAPIANRVLDLLKRMTLEEKIGQITLVDKNSVLLSDISDLSLGGLLSAGGGYPSPNTHKAWVKMTAGYQQYASRSRLGIPLLYGTDAVHGHGNAWGAVIFPHQIGLGAAQDIELAWRIGQATAKEMLATGINWNFSPCLAVPQDIRWGRTYEGYAEDPELVARLGSSYLLGLQAGLQGFLGSKGSVLATAKHFVGDGATKFGTAANGLLDQGDVDIPEEEIWRVHLVPYIHVLKQGALAVMASYSSIHGQKMHSHHYFLTEVLKEKLGFKGFIVSDYDGINQLAGSYYDKVVKALNAGVDMVMLSKDYRRFIDTVKKAYLDGAISQARLDDAVFRILYVKFSLGLFDRKLTDEINLFALGSMEHRALAREAVRKSLVLLKNDSTLPISKDAPLILVAGLAADDVGRQCGGWTIEWQGKVGNLVPGTSILAGIKALATNPLHILYERDGLFPTSLWKDSNTAKVGIVVVGEEPYAEGAGDVIDLELKKEDRELIKRMRSLCHKLIVILVSGRPMIISEVLPLADAFIAAWLPGSEGQGVAEVLFGDYPFTGKLPYSWPTSTKALKFAGSAFKQRRDLVLFPAGYGLTNETKP